MTTAFLFVGQGAELPWVSPRLLAAPAARALLDRASSATGVNVARLIARGGRDLYRPEILQPALVSVCLALDCLLEEAGVRPALCAGHSLGELSAWSATGAIARVDAVDAAAARGALMAREAQRAPGGMLALRDADEEDANAALVVGRRVGAVCIAGRSSPREWVLSGDDAALAAIAPRFATQRLPVAGAWHSPAMAPAEPELRALLERIPRTPASARLVTNRDGTIAPDPDAPALLAGQLTRPVEWSLTLERLAREGVTHFVTVGPGRLLRALVRQNLGAGAQVIAVEADGDVERAADLLIARRASA